MIRLLQALRFSIAQLQHVVRETQFGRQSGRRTVHKAQVRGASKFSRPCNLPPYSLTPGAAVTATAGEAEDAARDAETPADEALRHSTSSMMRTWDDYMDKVDSWAPPSDPGV